jgi:hypothetical protein
MLDVIDTCPSSNKVDRSFQQRGALSNLRISMLYIDMVHGMDRIAQQSDSLKSDLGMLETKNY